MEIREFHPYDLQDLGIVGPDVKHAIALKEGGDSFTVTVDGNPIACIGLITHWEKRRYVWAYLSPMSCRYMLPLTRAVGRWLKYHGEGRIETAVDCNFPPAARWVEMFGFVREGIMRHWSPDGRDYFLYARVS